MADSTTNAPSTAAASRTPASDATDPAVHQLLAELDIARRNLAAGQRDTDVAGERATDLKKVIDDKKKHIRDLGYSVD